MAGYSGTPLVKKIGIKPNHRLLFQNAPAAFAKDLGELPKGARPDLSIDGTIDLERIENVLYVGKPALGKEDGQLGLFKLTSNGAGAVQTQVKLGRSSAKYVEVLSGLNVGDKVILSDTSAYDNIEKLKLEQ